MGSADDSAEASVPRDWQMFYKGYQERFVDDCVLNLSDGAFQVNLAQAPSARAAQKKGQKDRLLDKAADPSLTGTCVWDGAIVLAHLLVDTDILGGKQWRCLELGSGTGAVSLALMAGRRVSSVTITDLPDLLPHIQLNLDHNRHLRQHNECSVTVKALRWGPPGDDLTGSEKDDYDLIVGSDLIYYTYSEDTPHSKLLLWTLQQITSQSTVIFLSLSLHHNPQEVEHFLSLCDPFFHIERLNCEIPKEWRVPDALVVRMRLKIDLEANKQTVGGSEQH